MVLFEDDDEPEHLKILKKGIKLFDEEYKKRKEKEMQGYIHDIHRDYDGSEHLRIFKEGMKILDEEYAKRKKREDKERKKKLRFDCDRAGVPTLLED